MIRAAKPADAEAVTALVTSAFGRDDEARLVERLRATDRLTWELVAEEDGALVGHIAFSPVRIGDETGNGQWWGLAPLAVAQAHRRRGIGAELVRSGLDAARLAGVTLVVVLGEPAFYGRLGFEPAEKLGLVSVYPVPPECFMALRLGTGKPPAGTLRYDPAFDAL
jgi:putative acetyltransferase